MRVQFEQRPQKSGKPSVPPVPSVHGCSRQFMARASIRASVYLPDPCAPQRITACGKRLRASISRRRWMVSGLPTNSEKGIRGAVGFSLFAKSEQRTAVALDFQFLAHQLHNNRMRFARRTSGVYDVHSLRLAGSDGQVRVAHTSEKSPVFLLKAVLVSFRAFF